MRDALLQTRLGQYEPGSFAGNQSGINPIGDLVLVKPDVAAEKTTGGVFIPQNLKDRQSMAAETGIVVEAGDGAFMWSSDRLRPFQGRKPQAGDRVCFTRYAGTEVPGADGEMYRLMSDNCIGATIGSE